MSIIGSKSASDEEVTSVFYDDEFESNLVSLSDNDFNVTT